MKRLFLVISLFSATVAAYAQELTDAQKAAADVAQAINEAPASTETIAPKPKYWKNSLSTKLDFGQTFLNNWAAGGYNTYSLKAFIDGNANYAKENISWTNRLQLDYGFLYSADKPVLQKSDDRIYLESKFGYNVAKNLFMSAEYSFKSQFSNTWNYPTPSTKADGTELGEGESYKAKDWRAVRTLKSGLLSPAYTNLALGINYTPLKWLSVNFAPLTGGFVIVENPILRNSYSMKLKKAYRDVDVDAMTLEEKDAYNEAMTSGNAYKSANFEFGAQLKIDIKVNVNDNFKYTSQILLFSDYLDHPENMRVNWDNRIEWKLAKYFSLMFTTNLIYDDKVMIYSEKDGLTKQRVQFRESLSFGFVYTIASKN
ncbi:MAG: DUF3078 domain-containing protein [Bacteroidales bacterium]|nr:DUF3078 domain-containing protein [Bacteroidales bacterium]MDE7126636.1 DUF3078 domain-containing protein [Bacteroidales bacterium]